MRPLPEAEILVGLAEIGVVFAHPGLRSPHVPPYPLDPAPVGWQRQ